MIIHLGVQTPQRSQTPAHRPHRQEAGGGLDPSQGSHLGVAGSSMDTWKLPGGLHERPVWEAEGVTEWVPGCARDLHKA